MTVNHQSFGIFIILACCIILNSCTSSKITKYTYLKKPEIKFQKYQIVAVSSKKVRLDLLFTVDNSNDLDIDSLFMDYELWVNNRRFITGLKVKLNLIPKGKSTLSIPIEISYQRLISTVATVTTLLAKGERYLPMAADIRIFGELTLAGLIKQDFSYKHRVNLLIPLPKYNMNDIQQFIQGVR